MKRHLAVPVLLLMASSNLAAQPPAALARRFLETKLLGQADTAPAEPHLVVKTKRGLLDKNRIQGRLFQIATRTYERGIAMPSPGEVTVHLPGPGARFEAVAGVDGNDLGYYANAGRGMVVASVQVGAREAFRSDVLREGLPGVPVDVDLGGAREFTLKLEAVGKRSRTYQAAWDQLDWADARVRLADGRTVWLADLPLGPLPGAWTKEPPFSFQFDGRKSAAVLEACAVSRRSEALGGGRTRHSVRWRDAAAGLTVRAEAVAYDDFPVIEWVLHFANESNSPSPILEDILPLDTLFERGPEGEFLLHHGVGSPNSPNDYQPLESPLGPGASLRIATRGGRPTDTALCYFNLESPGRGVILAIGWPGQWAAQFAREGPLGVRVRAGQERTRFRLLPGEEVRTPLVAVLFWQGDWIGGQNVWRRWMIAHNLPRTGGKLPPPQIAGGANRQTIEMQDASEENQLSYLARDLDAGLPLDYWWMDAGWYPFKQGWPDTGTWEPDPARFPRGLAPVSAAAHARGVKTIVWFEPERVRPGTWLFQNHPEWLLSSRGGNRLLYLGNPEARQWLVEHVSRLIREQGIDIYRQDFNFEPLHYWRERDAEDRQGITEIKHVTGLLAYWDELRRRFPNLMMDTCASGGRRNDLETLRRAVPLWRSDFAYQPQPMQLFTYGMALWIPYFGTGVNTLDPYIFRSQMTPAVAIGFEPGRLPDGYAKVRRLLAQWRSIAEDYYGDFYPLTPYTALDSAWLAWQFNRPEQGRGMVQVFRRPESPFESARFRLRGLESAARYRVKDLDQPEAARHLTGAELMESGLPVTVSARPAALLIEYMRVQP